MSGGAPAVDLDEAALNEQLQHQLEYYFSPQNLAVDTYLCSQMDEDKFVSISVVANFPKVTSLTHDLDKVVTALRGKGGACTILLLSPALFEKQKGGIETGLVVCVRDWKNAYISKY